MPERDGRPRGRLRLEVCDAGGRLAARRESGNLVLRGGAELIAKRFSGKVSSPIDRVAVGFGTEAADVTQTALTPPASPDIPASALSSPVDPDDFKVDASGPTAVLVSLASVFQPTVELKDVSEAGLLGDATLYNQVVFEPVTLKPGQDVTFFWEIEFPFGH
jgi:hypothetical protein